MAPPHFELETGYGGGSRVAGVDEAGRGPLAGPVLAAAVVFPERRAARPRRAARRQQAPAPRRARGRLRRAPRRRRRRPGGDRPRRRLHRRDRAGEHPPRHPPRHGAAPCRACRARRRWRWSTATSRRRSPARCAAWSAATRCASRSPPPRSWPRWCGTGRWRGSARAGRPTASPTTPVTPRRGTARRCSLHGACPHHRRGFRPWSEAHRRSLWLTPPFRIAMIRPGASAGSGDHWGPGSLCPSTRCWSGTASP